MILKGLSSCPQGWKQEVVVSECSSETPEDIYQVAIGYTSLEHKEGNRAGHINGDWATSPSRPV